MPNETPIVSVVMNTAHGNRSMTGFPDQDHFVFTIQALQRQTFTKFEFIVSDYIHDKRNFDWRLAGNCRFPIYHVPIEHSQAKNTGHCAISSTKNNGIMYSSGEYIVSLDDCCIFESKYLEKIYNYWQQMGVFPGALHIKDKGSDTLRNDEGLEVKDCRFKLLEDRKVDLLINEIDMYGYSSFSMEAALKLNGFDEMYDFGKGLEDTDMGKRLIAAGYRISIHKNLIVKEQQHLNVAIDPVTRPKGYNPTQNDSSFDFKPNTHCNGSYIFMKLEKRIGEDFIKANHRQMTAEEKAMMNPCYKLDRTGDTVKCLGSGRGCNWIDKHMVLPEAKIWMEQNPVFSLAEERNDRLNRKEKYRVK